MDDGLNPTRRYKWFRPRQAARGFGHGTAVAHNPAVLLYNNSTAAQYLVLRALQYIQDAGAETGLAFQLHAGVSGTLAMSGVPVIFGQATLPGQIYQYDDPVVITPDYFIPAAGDQSWVYDFPPVILTPNSSLELQTIAGSNFRVALLWEALFADELDYAFQL